MPRPEIHFYEFGPFRVDPLKRRLLRGGEVVPITPKALDILLVLIEHRGEVLNKEALMRAVWPDAVVEENNLTRNISTLRKALGEQADEHQYVLTVPGRGYSFVAGIIEHESVDDAQQPETKNGRRFRTSSLAALLVILVTAAGIPLWRYGFAEKEKVAVPIPFQKVEVTRLTNARNIGMATISPDGKYIVYSVRENGREGLWLRHVATDSTQAIVPPADVTFHSLALSPDGNYAYVVRSSEKESILRSLYRVHVLGGVPVKLIEDLVAPFALSPDGNQVVFGRNYRSAGESALIIANADGSDERRLATRPLHDPYRSPAWSPDGKVIACSVGTVGRGGKDIGIVEVRVEDGAERFLTSQKWYNASPSVWLHEGNGLLVNGIGGEKSEGQLWYLSYPGGEARPINNGVKNCGDIGLTSDAETMVCKRVELVADIWLLPEGDASRAQKLITGISLSWTPDGRIVYESDVDGNRDLYIMQQDGTDRKKLTAGPGKNGRPYVTPDGRSIVFTSNRTGTVQVWRMEIDGSNPVQLTNGNGGRASHISPDGRWALYIPTTDDGVWKVPVAGGESVQITSGHYAFHPVVSPDGELIAYHYREKQPDAKYKIAVTPLAGGQPTRMFDPPREDLHTFDIVWTIDGMALLYEATHHGVSNIWRQPLDGGEPQQLTNFRSDIIFSFALSHDGKRLICSRGNWVSDLMKVRNLR